ncbi:MAG TPA: lysine exporter LysO family protein [candidate division Zixibacteria bacterium]|nr:lysine exporter LysO family protein [candidate division Zixibacteria bacterium]
MIKYILAALILGGVAGYLDVNWATVVSSVWISDYLLNASLMLLLFVMGVVFAMDKDSISKIRRTGLRILIVPLAVALGTILSGVVSALILGTNVTATMAVSAGFGWYTLTGPLVSQVFGAKWGALGFAANFLRELLTILTVSLMVKVDKYAPTASGGATSMDTTLPIIVRYCGSDTLITAFSSGFVLSVMAPFAIMAIASLGHVRIPLFL